MIVDRFVTSRQLAETGYSLRHLFDSNLFCSVLFFFFFFFFFFFQLSLLHPWGLSRTFSRLYTLLAPLVLLLMAALVDWLFFLAPSQHAGRVLRVVYMKEIDVHSNVW